MEIDPRGPRFSAVITTIVLAVVLITGSAWLLAAQVAVFAVGALAGAAYDGIIWAIKDGLGNDVFTPVPVQLTVDDPNLIRQHPGIGGSHTVDIREMGAWYTIEYDWFLSE